MASSLRFLPMPTMVVLLFLLIQNSASTDNSIQNLIDEICRETTNTSFCKDVFNQKLNPSVKDFKGLAQISVFQTWLYLVNDTVFLENLYKDEKNEDLRSRYIVCRGLYRTANGAAEEAGLTFEYLHDLIKVKSLTQNCGALIANCEKNLKGGSPALSVKNKEIQVLTAMTIGCIRRV